MNEQSSDPVVELVVSAERFVSMLEPGDVLLFDTIHPISGLIKLGENRPVNHAALYVGDDCFAHVSRHDVGAPAIQRASLLGRLGGRRDRTVTALRHEATDGRSSVASSIVRQADEMSALGPSTYNYLDLVTLVLPSFFRSYDRYLRQGGELSTRLASMFETIVPTVLSVLEADGLSAGLSGGTSPPALPQMAMSLTCSEFVYRCFADAGYPIAIGDPLASWSGRWSRSRGGIEDSADEMLDLHEALFRPHEAVASSEPVSRSVAGTSRRALATRACKILYAVVRHNLPRHKYGPSIEAGTVLADAVTPRDLWCSPSLQAKAVLHLPPSGLDGELDEPYH